MIFDDNVSITVTTKCKINVDINNTPNLIIGWNTLQINLTETNYMKFNNKLNINN